MRNLKRITAVIFIVISLVLGVVLYTRLNFPAGPEPYFSRGYYAQFGPIAICVELLIAGLYLFKEHRKTNFALAVFGFTALLDPVFNYTGLLTSQAPLFATIIFCCCALVAL